MPDATPAAEQKYQCAHCRGTGYEPAVGDAPKPLMDKEKFERLSAKLFTAAVHHAERYGEVSFVDGDPDHWFQMCGPYAAFEAAADYFDECDFKYS